MEKVIIDFFSQYAHSPSLVYGAVCAFMCLSAFGLPIPEELVLISAGFVGYMSLHPGDYPPPYPGAPIINVYLLAAVAFSAVIASDLLIYQLGKRLGPRLLRTRWFERLISVASLEKIQHWTRKYGAWACAIFRFTPGIRFSGHLMCGAMGLSLWRFLAVDIIAAAISVPSQVLLVSLYGETILRYFRPVKIYVLCGLAAAIIIYVVYRLAQRTLRLRPTQIITAASDSKNEKSS